MSRILTVVPARGGSKGLPGKNIRPLLGKPLIAWSIEQGLASKYVDEVIVSTDDDQIAAVALEYGARVPFLRPSRLAEDSTSTADVLVHLIEELEKAGEYYDYIMLLEPTSPLRETGDIDAAFERLQSTPDARSIVGICQVESQHPAFCVTLTPGEFIRSGNDFKVLRRQEIDQLYFYEGSVYISDMETYKQHKNFYHRQTLGYEVPKWKSFEVDDITDFLIVEAILKNKPLVANHK
ncbi:acylneuraminate cytidylyltransferase family protein [Chitinophaga lutea]